MNVIEVVSEGGGPHSTATACSPGGASGAAGDNDCIEWHSVPAASLVLEHTWHIAVRLSPIFFLLGVRGGASGTPVSAALVTSRAILCLLVSRAIIGGTRDGVNEQVSRQSPAASDQSPLWDTCTSQAHPAGETATRSATCQE